MCAILARDRTRPASAPRGPADPALSCSEPAVARVAQERNGGARPRIGEPERREVDSGTRKTATSLWVSTTMVAGAEREHVAGIWTRCRSRRRRRAPRSRRDSARDPAASRDPEPARLPEHLDDARRGVPHHRVAEDALVRRQRWRLRADDREQRIDARQHVNSERGGRACRAAGRSLSARLLPRLSARA